MLNSKLIFNIDNFYKTARAFDNIDILKNNIGNYIHFSDSDRFGISYHKDIHPGNPRGVYGFPLTRDKFNRMEKGAHLGSFEEYSESKYIYIFSVNGNILNLENFSIENTIEDIKKFILSRYKNKIDDMYTYYIKHNLLTSFYIGNKNGGIFTFIHEIFNVLRNNGIVSNEHSTFNIILRAIGYDAIETNNYGFGDGIATQIAVVNPLAVNLIAKINNFYIPGKDYTLVKDNIL
jgi:hypothetical protein